ncbi:death-associated inhibitor of apoptosis 1 [Harpegnathos saltator]|uniref:Apoptosis inhibitor IAP n=1 Tax=Harpegnathos saltator TaxID=610380 RepID=E2C5M2_HARSA|nr:death-associated inhibitor of apoptosis 1 [Harpegnathos saltator]XP_011151252.1 death-associated inhibitor of apoptosis 1 [Harpegnathos saltator]XP_011151253.1 death-associated inhibitor of apoptosis 1 [Harpegnathos saltator]EFN76761.1 Apoptosis inhibitor IAP [Harpegnathos saltator]
MTECIERNSLLTDGLFKSPSNLHLPQSSSIFFDEIDNIDYHFEDARLESYKDWPCVSVRPERLAAAGFYYTGESDKVRCFECHVEISQWLPDDDPMVDHQRWSGKCRFIRGIPCGNVPKGVDPSTIPPSVPRGRDVCGPYGIEYCPNGTSDTNVHIQDTVTLNLGGRADPKHPQFANYDDRLRTFEMWPISIPQTKEQLAAAGFYYTGNGDQTLCYYCGGGLKDWEPEDDPWEQHAKWFSKCCYLLMVQGQEYVNKVTGKSSSKQENYRQSVTDEDEKVDDECYPGPSSQNSTGSQDSGFESIGSCTESNKFSNDQLSINKSPSNNLHGKIDDARMCKICYNRELRKVFVPCGHLVACAECAKNMKTCAVCRKPVVDTVQAIIS